jgi:ribose 5-phosphate isomerase B
MIYIGADHRGFSLKGAIKNFLKQKGEEVVDVKEAYQEEDDYPDIAAVVAEQVSQQPEQEKGIVICGSGVGVAIVANKFPDIRCGLCTTAEQAIAARNDDDINVLALASDITNEQDALEIVEAFLHTPFAQEERFVRRIKKITDIEKRS